MDLRSSRTSVSFHSRASSDMVRLHIWSTGTSLSFYICRRSSYIAQALPSHGAVLWPRYKRAIPLLVQHCVPGCHILRTRGYLALLVASSASLGPTLQVHPQNSPSTLGPVWSCGRIRFSHRSLSSWTWHRRLSDPLVRNNRRSTYFHYVPLDRMSALSSYWRT